MNEQPSNPPVSTVGLGDVMFTIFRHKWKITFFFLLGIGAAAAVYYLNKPLYYSETKLLVRYVTESRGPDTDAPGEVVKEPVARGASIMSSEVEILSSRDSILQAVEKVGAQRVLAAYGGGTSKPAAGKLVADSLKVQVERNSSVISVKLGHRDPEIARETLNEIKLAYLRRHQEVHRSANTFDFLDEQTRSIRRRLENQEEELRRQKNSLNVTSIQEAKDSLIVQLTDLDRLINESTSEITAREAQLALLQEHRTKGVTNAKAQQSTTNGSPAQLASDPVTLASARRIAARLERLKSYELDLSNRFAPESTTIGRIQREIADLETQLANFGIDPAALEINPTTRPETRGRETVTGIVSEPEIISMIAISKAKLAALNNQREELKQRITAVNSAEGAIVETERQKALTEDLYLYFSKNLERARIDQALNVGKINNISIVQEPSFATRDFKEIAKMAGAAFAACAALGIVIAFVSDFLLNPSIIRRKQIESVLRLPVFASVPEFGRNGRSQLRAKRKQLRSGSVAVVKDAHGRSEIAPWDEQDPMLPYYEAIRDRLVMSYEDDAHKPKIVGLTSDHHGAGVTRLATGVAAALSRDVERKVLLIGLAKNNVAVSEFVKGRPAIDFSSVESSHVDAIGTDLDQSESAVVSKNLHSLAVTGRNLAGASVVQSFCDLIPKLRAADYDYIIFDLPPLSETSGAIRLASQMERTVFIVEAEKSSKEHLKRVRSLLGETRTQLSAVYNRARDGAPKILQSEA